MPPGKAIALWTDIALDTDKCVIAAIHLNKRNDRFEFHKVASLYGRDNSQAAFRRWFDGDKMLYYKNKALLRQHSGRLQLPLVLTRKDSNKKSSSVFPPTSETSLPQRQSLDDTNKPKNNIQQENNDVKPGLTDTNVGESEVGYQLRASSEFQRDHSVWKHNYKQSKKHGFATKIAFPKTPAVLQKLGAKKGKMILNRSKAKRIFSEHSGMTEEVILELPKSLVDPIAIFKSSPKSSTGGRNSYVILTDMFDANNKPVIVAIHPNIASGNYVINKIASIYGRNKASKAFEKWGKDGLLKYIRDEKSFRDYFVTDLQLLRADQGSQKSHDESSIKYIYDKDDLVNYAKAKKLGYQLRIRHTEYAKALEAHKGIKPERLPKIQPKSVSTGKLESS